MKRLLGVTVTILTLVYAPIAHAGGYRLIEQSNSGQGMGHAVAASVDDASAVYYNPAAMTEIDGYASMIGAQVIDVENKYDGQGANISTANTSFVVPHAYVVKNYKDRGLAVGLGLFTNFGTGTTWSQNSPLRHTATDSQLSAPTVNLSVAKEINEKLSVAVGVNYMKADATYDAMYPFGLFQPGAADGFVLLRGEGSAFGFNAALHYRPNEKMKVGLTYRSEMTATMNGDVEVSNFPDTLVPLLRARGISGDDYKSTGELDIPFPDIIVFAISYQLTDKLMVELDIDHTRWSVYESFDVNIDKPLILPTGIPILPASSSTEKNWNDVTAIRIAAAYKFSPSLTLKGGYYYDPTPIPDESFEPRIPDRDHGVISFGAGYRATDNFTLDVAYAYVPSTSRSVNNTVGNNVSASIDGDYDTSGHIYGLSFGYSF